MRRTYGAVLVAATVTLAGWAGVATAAPTSPAASPTPTPTVACPPVLPVVANVSGSTATSLSIGYSVMLGPPCGYELPITVSLYASAQDAAQWQNPVAQAVSGPDRFGTVTVEGLTPDTAYWFRVQDADGHRDPYLVGGPGRTTP
ncbi:hypothetical protein [Micromonospora rosaria]|uniref:hypothetical protein n=1 Tax=Micromonospora rosaria TaxID=47874 RepID=UPI000ACCC487|nr:hypothetical protein [Micromonospora rosaria]